MLGDIGIYRDWSEDSYRYFQRVKEILEKVASFSTKVFYLPGETDPESLDIESESIVNLDKDYTIIEGSKRVGLLGLGGAPSRSIRTEEHFSYLWDEGDNFIRDEIENKLKVNLEKVRRKKLDVIILLTHSPPHGFADKSIPISLREILDRDELPDIPNKEEGDTSRANPKHLGSRLLKKFIRGNPINIHFSGHVHKRGGNTDLEKGVRTFNASHLAPSPRKLYGRKFLRVRLDEDLEWKFQSVTNSTLGFEEYLESYL